MRVFYMRMGNGANSIGTSLYHVQRGNIIFSWREGTGG
jgi:hypothetical protein